MFQVLKYNYTVYQTAKYVFEFSVFEIELNLHKFDSFQNID